MSYFYDSNLSLKEALNYFYTFYKNNGGQIDKSLRIQIQKLDNNSRSAGITSANSGIISLKEPPSIITLFHELKHIIGRTQNPITGFYDDPWIYENNYNATVSFYNGLAHINRSIKGLFIAEGIAELYATKAYWALCNNSKLSKEQTRNHKFYDQEVLFIYKVCTILDIDVDYLINLPSKHGRDILKRQFEYYSNGCYKWDDLEAKCDFVEMEKNISLNHSDYTIDDISLKKIRQYKYEINVILAKVLSISYNIGIITETTLERKLAQFNSLVLYKA